MNHTLKTLLSKKVLTHILASMLLEFGPVLLFLFSYEHFHVYESTVILMVATIISTIVTYRVQKRIPYVALYVAGITLIFGAMTLHSHKVKFIQIRDTLYDITAALTLLAGLRFHTRFLELAFGAVIPMSIRAWNKLTYLWIGFFIFLAVNNEFARHYLSLDNWFVMKSVAVCATVVFGMFALYISYEEKANV